MADTSRLRALQDEATSRFVGQGVVVGAAIGDDDEITIFLADDDEEQKQTIRSWARARSVGLNFIVSGRFKSRVAT
jgi:hypothetical protein